MFHELVSHNNDIKKLLVKGYAIALDSNHLVVRDVPYIDSEGQLQSGAIVSKLKFVNKQRAAQHDHQIYFAGSHPHGIDGKPIKNLGGGPHSITLDSSDVVVERSFSNKPKNGFADHFDKIESYVRIISGPAMERDGANPFTFRSTEKVAGESVFKFQDTLTSLAEIGDLSALFKDEVIAIIGLGGTGSYVLDLMVKTPVKRILGYDRDPYHVHNAFRSPGRLDEEKFDQPKAAVYQGRYENFREGVTLVAKHIDASCADELKEVTFAFVCVDKGSSRAGIFDLLIAQSISFIDVGLGLDRKQGALNGMLRATYFAADNAEALRDRDLAELVDHGNDEYRVNVQTAELNALNACIAVIRYKQIKGFYLDENAFNHMLFKVNDLTMLGEEL